MEGLVNLVACLVAMIILAMPMAVIYKYRAKIKRWIKEPTYGDLSTFDVDGVKRAERGVIKAQWKLEDAEDYLKWKKERKQPQEQKEVKDE